MHGVFVAVCTDLLLQYAGIWLWHVVLDQGSKAHPLQWKADSWSLDHQGSPDVCL